MGLRLQRRSDVFVACFPGDGLGYGSHYDGDSHCKLTMILYTSEGWQPAHGGCLEMLDETRGCWWRVPPLADTLVLFRSDRVLHRVAPCYGEVPRFALTIFLSEAAVDAEQQALIRLVSGMV